MAKKASDNKFDPKAYAYSICREAHSWKPYDGTIDEKLRLAFRVQRCPNCTTKKHSVISMRVANYGITLRSHYQWPKDYRVPGGLDRMDKGKLRIRNFLEEIGQIN